MLPGPKADIIAVRLLVTLQAVSFSMAILTWSKTYEDRATLFVAFLRIDTVISPLDAKLYLSNKMTLSPHTLSTLKLSAYGRILAVTL